MDGDITRSAWTEDLNVLRWFPAGYSTRYTYNIPYTTFNLVNDFTLITALTCSQCPVNETLQRATGLAMRGNLLVLKHSARTPMALINVSSADRQLIEFIMYRYAPFPQNAPTSIIHRDV